MRVSIHTLGTRGDVQPYLALAVALRARGHEALLIAPAQFEAMAAAHSVPFAALPAEFLDILQSPEAKALIGRSAPGFGAGWKLLKHYRGLMQTLMTTEATAARDFASQGVVFHPKSLAGPHIAEQLGIGSVLALPLPGLTPTSAFPSPLLPFASLGPFNRASHGLMIHGAGVLFGGTIRRWRENALGLSGKGRPPAPRGTLYAYSPAVLPKPRDWDDTVDVTGYWTLATPEWSPPADLAAFLSKGEAPVFVGFGSMPEADPHSVTSAVIEGLRCAGKRGLLATAGGAITRMEAGEDIMFIDGAPHDRLLPLMHSAIHHGGAGTTGAVLRAGIPGAICPFLGDQPFWARRVHELGVGPMPLRKHQLSGDTVAAAVTAMEDPQMRSRAVAIGEIIRGEDGLGRAVARLEQWLPQG